MNELCQIGNFKLSNINYLFCSLCNKIITNKSIKCQNSLCKIIICEDCYNKNKIKECPKCKRKKLSDFSVDVLQNINELFFFCSKSMKCKGQYSLEDYQRNHSHVNSQINKCDNCNISLYNSPNILNCIKCKNIFYHKNINYNPMLCKSVKHSTKNCGKRCFKCHKPLCNKCIKNHYNYIICSECNYKCEMCSKNKSDTICESCDKMLCNSCVKICKKCSVALCATDCNKNDCSKHKTKLNKDKKCSICKTNKSLELCCICNNSICSLNCLIICNIDSCQNKICINCTLFCNICKKLICKKCVLQCSNCPKEKSLISCKECNSDTIFNCSMKNCQVKSCLKCVKFCNYCKEINCSSHSLPCANCKETICKFHWHICKKCTESNDDYSQKKLCLKNCTYKCNLCTNEINALCKEENHIEDFCRKYPCGHYICNSCVKRCDNCNNVIQACSDCNIEKNYVHCRFCNKSLCYDCSSLCSKCNDYYCNEPHYCYLCSKAIKSDVCPNCDFVNRSKCLVCSKGLSQCESCFKKIICSSSCFLDYIKTTNNNNNNNKKKNKGFMRSYTIQSNKSTSYKSSVTNNMINSVINLFQTKDKEKERDKNSTMYNNNYKNKSELNTERGKHLCTMYWCEEHIGINSDENIKIKSNNLKDLITKDSSNRVQRYKIVNNQTNTKCSSCNIM